MHVRVNDVNEFAPVFVERLYRAAVTEGKLYDRILRVEAIDGDCSPQYSQICYYEILTPNTPFLIDNDGECIPCGPGPRPWAPTSLRTPRGLNSPLVSLRSPFHTRLPNGEPFSPRHLLPRLLLPDSPVAQLAHESSPFLPSLSLAHLTLFVFPPHLSQETSRTRRSCSTVARDSTSSR